MSQLSHGSSTSTVVFQNNDIYIYTHMFLLLFITIINYIYISHNIYKDASSYVPLQGNLTQRKVTKNWNSIKRYISIY